MFDDFDTQIQSDEEAFKFNPIGNDEYEDEFLFWSDFWSEE